MGLVIYFCYGVWNSNLAKNKDWSEDYGGQHMVESDISTEKKDSDLLAPENEIPQGRPSADDIFRAEVSMYGQQPTIYPIVKGSEAAIEPENPQV